MSDRAAPMGPGTADSYGEPTPQDMMTPPTLQQNRNNGGNNPTNVPTGPKHDLPTIGTRGQERGED